MKDDEQDRQLQGDFVSFLRWLVGIDTQAELSRKSGVPRTEINRYEQGKQKPQESTLQQMTTRVGVPRRLLSFFRWYHRLIRKAYSLATRSDAVPPSELRLADETRVTVCEIVERSLALARAEHAFLRSTLAVDRKSSPYPPRVEALFQKLIIYPEGIQRMLIEGSSSYRDPLLCLRLCQESEDVASDDPVKAQNMAKLALMVAERVDCKEAGKVGLRSRLVGWCTGVLGNAQRAAGSDLPGAERAFARAWRLWQEGEDPVGLLSEARLLDLEASLRGDQRLFNKALQLHDKALAVASPAEVGHLLLNKACTQQEMGKHEDAIQTLEKVAQHIDGERQPRLRFAALFNKAANLLHLGRASEAVPLVHEVRSLAEGLRKSVDLVRTLWLEGNCAAGLGQKDQALSKLEQVRHEFEKRNNSFDYALASLDVALLCREEKRFAEIKVLADEMLTIFKAQQVHRETIAAVILFQEAAEKEEVTSELVKQFQDYLSKARRNPRLRFEGQIREG